VGFQDQPLWVAIAAFAIAAAFVWAAGTRLSRYLDRIADLTGVGAGFLGLLVLGGVTSLPEAATVGSAALLGNAPLAVNNLLGSASVNIVLLAVADALIGRRALTSIIGDPTPLLQGALGILLLTIVASAILIGDVAVGGIGLWPMLLVALFLAATWLTSQYEDRRPWSVTHPNDGSHRAPAASDEEPGGSLPALVLKTVAAAAVILVAGFTLAQSGDTIATKTGVGASLVGLVLLSFATSLAEVSTVYAAVKLRRYSMAMGDIFGTNMFNVVLIFLADLLFSGPPVLNAAGTFEAVATLLAILLTSIYMAGLLERRNKTFFRMGYASLGVLITYAGGVAILYQLAP